jgi:hypothetical protein
MMQYQLKSILKIMAILVVIIFTVAYSIYQSRNLIKGPQISLMTPETGSTLANPLVAIKGVAENISFISLNDRQIFVDNEGNFSEELLLSPGYNLWEIEAKDKFGRIVSKKIELILK